MKEKGKERREGEEEKKRKELAALERRGTEVDPLSNSLSCPFFSLN
jgi:hypothetical protein